MVGAEPFEDGVAAHAGEHQIENDEIESVGVCFKQSDGGGAVSDEDGLIAFGLAVVLEAEADVLFIFDDEDAMFHGTRGSRSGDFFGFGKDFAGEVDIEGGAFEDAAAVDMDAAFESVNEGFDQIESQSCSLGGPFEFGPAALEASEEFASEIETDPLAVVGDFENEATLMQTRFDGDLELGGTAGVLGRVVEKVGDDDLEVFGPSANDGKFGTGESDLRGFQIVTAEDFLATGLEDGEERDLLGGVLTLIVIEFRGDEEVVDEGIEAFDILHHHLVEFSLLVLPDIADLHRLEVELEGGDGGFEFVCDGIDEVGLTPGELDFLEREDEIEDDADEDQGEEDNPEGQERPLALGGLPDDPEDEEGDGQDEEDDSQNDRPFE